ncbi:hypothetical protein QJS65_13955 [Bacillus altitudinis]|uniref:hypothetical protein n=1 Tax=Bacillus altitudinis TaxID=293387 RepID=UPI0024A7DF55|nr:hypothetical protein [Bacillus altitudinis]WHF25928.1 hypothetical protein QJS65_13955 [Bacillus altitudinis]
MKIFRSLILVSLSLVLMLSVSSTPLLAQQNEVISKNQINYESSLYVTNENSINNELEARAKWGGQFSSNYTIPSYVVASAATYGMFHITRYLTATLQLGPAAAAAFAGMISGYVSAKGEIKLKAVQKYRWIKEYTKAEYQATTKYMLTANTKQPQQKNGSRK